MRGCLFFCFLLWSSMSQCIVRLRCYFVVYVVGVVPLVIFRCCLSWVVLRVTPAAATVVAIGVVVVPIHHFLSLVVLAVLLLPLPPPWLSMFTVSTAVRYYYRVISAAPVCAPRSCRVSSLPTRSPYRHDHDNFRSIVAGARLLPLSCHCSFQGDFRAIWTQHHQ